MNNKVKLRPSHSSNNMISTHVAKFTGLCLLVLNLLYFTNCAKENTVAPDADQENATMEGIVKDKNNNPLKGVTVTAEPGGNQYTTKADGSYKISGLAGSKADSPYTLTFFLPDYIDTTVTVGALSNSENKPILPMKLKYRYVIINGTVVSGATPVSNVGIAVQDQGISVQSGNGAFTLKKVEPGDSIILLTSNGQNTGKYVIPSISSDTTIDIKIDQQSSDVGGTISGQLKMEDSSGTSAKRSAVNVTLNNVKIMTMGGALEATSDDSGFFALNGIPAGFLNAQVIYNGDTLNFAGVKVENDRYLDLKTIYLQKNSIAKNGIILKPYPNRFIDTDASTLLMLGYKTSDSTQVIKKFKWDLNADGNIDTITVTPRLVLKTKAMVQQMKEATTHRVIVQAVDTSGKESEKLALRIEKQVSRVFGDSGVIKGTLSFNGAISISESSPIIVALIPKNDLAFDGVRIAFTKVFSAQSEYRIKAPAGLYYISMFIDINNNGKRDVLPKPEPGFINKDNPIADLIILKPDLELISNFTVTQQDLNK